MHELDFTRHNLAVDLEEVKRMFQEDFNGGCRHLVRLAFKEIMKMEVTDYLQAERYERGDSRRGRRNGYRKRTLLTSVGRITSPLTET